MSSKDMFATELEQLLEKHTSVHQYPTHAEPPNATREWHECDICGEEDSEAWAIPHTPVCMAGKVQGALLDD
jgi:hypothetical protein